LNRTLYIYIYKSGGYKGGRISKSIQSPSIRSRNSISDRLLIHSIVRLIDCQKKKQNQKKLK